MKFLRTIRMDPSDTRVFERAAEPGEWALPASFWYWDVAPDQLEGKAGQAFKNGFLSIESWGFSTLVTVSEIAEDDCAALVNSLAIKLDERFGAPTMDAAMEAARGEIDYVTEMCEAVPVNTLFAIRREVNADGNIVESFHKVEVANGQLHTRIWEIVE